MHRSGFFISGGTAIKGFVVAAPMSGSGKTTVSLGLMASLKRRGLAVAPFKIGPDFIDPAHHARITGRVSRNLDGWMLPEDYNRHCYRQAAKDADIAVVEGVMGLFDGYDGKSEAGSTAQMAKLLGLPVVLVVDAGGMARSVAALVQGFENFDRDLEVAGLIFNNLGSDRHLSLLTEALSGNTRTSCLGGILKDSRVTIPERHLGLVIDDEAMLSDVRIDRLADLVDAFVDVDRLLDRLEAGISGRGDPSEGPPRDSRVKIGVARDKAFCFYYQDNLDLLKTFGAEIVPFSPVADRYLPPGLQGLYLGGGYPELYAKKLSRNQTMLNAVRDMSLRGLPVYAECGGFMYLCESLTDLEGRPLRMAGCFPLQVRMTPGLASLGYREVILGHDTVIGKKGLVIRGHEFHYSTVAGNLPAKAQSVYEIAGRGAKPDNGGGYQVKNTLGSYHHLHFGSCPEAAAAFVAACRVSAVPGEADATGL